MRELLHKMEKELKPIFDQMAQLKDMTPPDYGSLTDWAYEKRATEAKRAQGMFWVSGLVYSTGLLKLWETALVFVL